jgi:hypothetical protein
VSRKYEPLLSGDSFALKRAISTKTLVGAEHRLTRALERLARAIVKAVKR